MCIICGKPCTEPLSLYIHIQTHHKQEMINYMESNDIHFPDEPEQTDGSPGFFKCVVCKWGLPDLRRWKDHFRTHNEILELLANLMKSKSLTFSSDNAKSKLKLKCINT